jgi:hypothetical protein
MVSTSPFEAVEDAPPEDPLPEDVPPEELVLEEETPVFPVAVGVAPGLGIESVSRVKKLS